LLPGIFVRAPFLLDLGSLPDRTVRRTANTTVAVIAMIADSAIRQLPSSPAAIELA
jgi:hypothetical protein